MTDWADMTAIWGAFDVINRNEFGRLRLSLPEGVRPDRSSFAVWDGMRQGDAGISLWLATQREDGRGLSWGVELYVYRDEEQGWRASVKGEIDLEDDQGNERCVLNEQTAVADAASAARAINELAESVTKYPLDELLTMSWDQEPVVDITDSEPPPGAALTTTMRIVSRSTDPE
jgi:hypothetical protein